MGTRKMQNGSVGVVGGDCPLPPGSATRIKYTNSEIGQAEIVVV